jgi:hypothetical protein
VNARRREPAHVTTIRYGVVSERIARGALLVTVVMAFVIGCTSRPEDALIGRWEEVDGIDDLRFHDDGTVTIGSEGALVGGNYRFVGEDRLELSFGPPGSPFPPRYVRITLGPDTMTVVEEERGRVRKYRRSRPPD